MKQTFKFTFLLVIIFIGMNLQAQIVFEGTLHYETTITGPNASIMLGFIPASFVVNCKNKSIRIEMQGGMLANMMGPILCSADSANAYMIIDEEKTLYRFDRMQYKTNTKAYSSVDALKKTKKIAGYKCNLYQVTKEDKSGKTIINIWTTDKFGINIPVNNPASRYFTFEGVEGFPLLMETIVNQQHANFTITISAIEIKPGIVKDELIQYPKGYKIVNYVPPKAEEF